MFRPENETDDLLLQLIKTVKRLLNKLEQGHKKR